MKNKKILLLMILAFILSSQVSADDDYININNLPAKIKTYLNKEHAGISIKEAEFDDGRYKIELRNGIEIKFDRKGNLLYKKMDDDRYDNDDKYEYKKEYKKYEEHKGGDNDDDYKKKEKYINKNQLPVNAQNYLNQNFNGVAKLKVERDNNYYEVKLRNGTELKFDLNGNLLYKKMDDDRYDNDDKYEYKKEHKKYDDNRYKNEREYERYDDDDKYEYKKEYKKYEEHDNDDDNKDDKYYEEEILKDYIPVNLVNKIKDNANISKIEKVETIKVDNGEKLKVKAKEKGYLFGFIEIEADSEIIINPETNEIEHDRPWYWFLVF